MRLTIYNRRTTSPVSAGAATPSTRTTIIYVLTCHTRFLARPSPLYMRHVHWRGSSIDSAAGRFIHTALRNASLRNALVAEHDDVMRAPRGVPCAQNRRSATCASVVSTQMRHVHWRGSSIDSAAGRFIHTALRNASLRNALVAEHDDVMRAPRGVPCAQNRRSATCASVVSTQPALSGSSVFTRCSNVRQCRTASPRRGAASTLANSCFAVVQRSRLQRSAAHCALIALRVRARTCPIHAARLARVPPGLHDVPARAATPGPDDRTPPTSLRKALQ